MARNMAHSLTEIGGRKLFVAIHTKNAPSGEEWAGWAAMLEKNCHAVEWDLGRIPNFVVTDGGAPSTAQRTEINVLIAQAKTLPPVAIVTDSTFVRTMIRAFSLFNPSLSVFSPADVAKAAAHVGVAKADVPQLIGALTKLEKETFGEGMVHTLGALTRIRT
jgi:hypothetical protein